MNTNLFSKKELHYKRELPTESFRQYQCIEISKADTAATAKEIKLPGRESILLFCLSLSIMLSYLSSLNRLPLVRVVRRYLPVENTPFCFPCAGGRKKSLPKGKAHGSPTFALRLYMFKPVRGKSIPRTVVSCGNYWVKDKARRWGRDLSANMCHLRKTFRLYKYISKQPVRILHTPFLFSDSSPDSCFLIPRTVVGDEKPKPEYAHFKLLNYINLPRLLPIWA
ncbi:hypothetical protein M2451_003991 [Dysgonomonas sp. PFB1-18]|nr:hypothetical protein [Dysgonomonas sp. PF1-14]MDH6341006.1 hypothetical protein [Dysgonomonas sp. PF1-16]MDH6382646.1 hypothetical protein [Dysgonomonas sp. PFB1-18]MDH6400005.1 hypothetical protein [Dysgonomonas sp. PF1-23]